MPVLVRASSGYLLRHPWQLGLLLLGIATGVAVIVAVDLANNSARTAFRLSMDAVNGAATHQVVGGPGGVDEAVYTTLRTVDGMQSIAPLVEGEASVGARSLHVLGIDPLADLEFRGTALRGKDGSDDWGGLLRSLLTTRGAVLLAPGTAAGLGLSVGQAFDIVTNGIIRPAVLAGYLHQERGNSALAQVLVTDIGTAQVWLGMAGRLSHIDARLPAGDDAASEFRERLPPGVQLLTAERRTQSMAEMSRAFTTNLTAMSLLALLVGIFLIYNSVSFSVLQRRGLLGILRALGMTRTQVLGLILGEALLLGVAGATLGVLAGVELGNALLGLVTQSINDLYFRVSVEAVTVSAWTLVKGVAAGVLATLLAAAVPAFEAARVAPRLALARSALETRSHAALPGLALGGVLLVAVAFALLGFASHGLVAGLVALFLAILGVALTIPLCVLLFANLLAPLAKRLGGSSARLAIAGIAQSLSRTGVAIVALAIAVATTLGVSIMVQSFRGSVAHWLDGTLAADVYVGVAGGGVLDTGLVQDLLATAGIDDWSSRRRVWLESDSGQTRLLAAQLAERDFAGLELLDARNDEVRPAFEEDGAVLVSETLAYRRGLHRGDTVFLETARGRRAFPVAATWRSYDANPGAILMSRKIYDTFWHDRGVDSLALHLATAADPDTVMTAVLASAGGRQALAVRSNRQLRELSLAIFDRTFVITNVLYWLAVGVALIGILGALLALQLERAREFALVRALGMTPAEVGRMVTLQSGFIGLLCGLAAIPLGLLMAWMLIDVINRRAFGWSMDMQVDGSLLLHGLVMSAGAALLAGLYPAWRAARANPALAMRED